MSDTKPTLNRAKIVDWVMLIVVVGLLLWAAIAKMGPSMLERGVGTEAPVFKLETRSGNVVALGDHAGKVVLLDFWATWCQPCFKQMPAIQAVADDYQDELVVLAVNVDDPTEDRGVRIDAFLKKAGVDADALLDDGSVANMYGVESIPALVVIDPGGKIYWASSGVHPRDVLAERIAEATEQP